MSLSAMLAGLRPPRRVADSRPPARDSVAVPTRLQSASRSHVGLVRSINEDRVLDRPDAGLWAVIDGMGGHAAGDVAAETALRALQALADQGSPTPADVEAALIAVNAELHAAGRATGLIRGATAVVLLRTATGFSVAWVGDCRAYRQRGGTLAPLTRDHSIVQELVDAGALTAEEALAHPQANVVTRALGAAAMLAIETRSFDMATGDLVLLCSDGLVRALSGRASLTAGARDLAALADDLIAAALDRDGRDNISLALIAGEAFRGA